jgi:hypothetical protein
MMLLRRRKPAGDVGRAERYRRRQLLWKAIELHNAGTLSDEEFDSLTSRLLGGQPLTDAAELDAIWTHDWPPSGAEPGRDDGRADRDHLTRGSGESSVSPQ